MAIAKIKTKKTVYLRGQFFASKCSHEEFSELAQKMKHEYNMPVGEFTHGMKIAPPASRAYVRRRA